MKKVNMKKTLQAKQVKQVKQVKQAEQIGKDRKTYYL
jgi:hypothetical protein